MVARHTHTGLTLLAILEAKLAKRNTCTEEKLNSKNVRDHASKRRSQKRARVRESERQRERENEEVNRYVYIDATVRLRSHAPRTVQGSLAQRSHMAGPLGISDKRRCAVKERQK